MFNFIKRPFDHGKEQIARPFLCDQVKQFGSCKGPCSDRHVLCKTLDKVCLDIPIKCFVGIQLTQILSASHFYGKILRYSTVKDPIKDEHWINVDDSYERIKYELNSSLHTKILQKNPIIGEMVMIEKKCGEFFRAVVLDIVSGWLSVNVKVKLIDLGPTEEVSSNKVFVLPSHLKEIRPVAIEIIVSSMEPAGEKDSIFSWPISTTHFVRNLLEPIILTDLELICKVDLIIGTTLWINSMLVKKCIKCSHFACKLYQNALLLPRELIERNIAKTSSQLIDKLTDLNKNAHVWEEPVSVEKLKNTSRSNGKSNVSLFSCEEKQIATNEAVQVQWAHLSEDMVHNVYVHYVEHPKCILLLNKKFLDRIHDLQRDIDVAIKNNTVDKLTNAIVGTVCLAPSPKENKYNRVLIKQIIDQSAIVLYVDYGELFMVNIETLLTITSHLITKLPFQIIECSLSGFKDIQNDTVDQFNDRLLQHTNTQMFLKVLSSSMDSKLTGGKNYEVVLFNDDMNINITMSNEFNMYVDNTQIQNISRLNYKCDEYKDENEDEVEYEKEDGDEDENEDEVEDEDYLENQFKFLKSLLKISDEKKENQFLSNLKDLCYDKNAKNKPNTNQCNLLESLLKISDEKNDNQILSNSKELSYDKNAKNKPNTKTENHVKIDKNYCMDCNATTVVPQCFWHQDDKWIYLKLNILSVNNFSTSHTVDTITINVETNSVSYSFKVILYAFILDESYVCHVGFDGIHIKAQKLVQVSYRWPRLVKCSKKHKYLIYDTEYVSVHKNLDVWITMMNKFKILALNQPLNEVIYNSDCDDSDEDDSSYNENGICED